VGSLSLEILIGYAVCALGILTYLILKEIKIKKAEMAIS
jgi:hypothetical protein